MKEVTVKKTCTCEHCGNEAEMDFTCSLPEEKGKSDSSEAASEKTSKDHKVKGTATCTRCGNEAEMWIDFD